MKASSNTKKHQLFFQPKHPAKTADCRANPRGPAFSIRSRAGTKLIEPRNRHLSRNLTNTLPSKPHGKSGALYAGRLKKTDLSNRVRTLLHKTGTRFRANRTVCKPGEATTGKNSRKAHQRITRATRKNYSKPSRQCQLIRDAQQTRPNVQAGKQGALLVESRSNQMPHKSQSKKKGAVSSAGAISKYLSELSIFRSSYSNIYVYKQSASGKLKSYAKAIKTIYSGNSRPGTCKLLSAKQMQKKSTSAGSKNSPFSDCKMRIRKLGDLIQQNRGSLQSSPSLPNRVTAVKADLAAPNPRRSGSSESRGSSQAVAEVLQLCPDSDFDLGTLQNCRSRLDCQSPDEVSGLGTRSQPNLTANRQSSQTSGTSPKSDACKNTIRRRVRVNPRGHSLGSQSPGFGSKPESSDRHRPSDFDSRGQIPSKCSETKPDAKQPRVSQTRRSRSLDQGSAQTRHFANDKAEHDCVTSTIRKTNRLGRKLAPSGLIIEHNPSQSANSEHRFGLTGRSDPPGVAVPGQRKLQDAFNDDTWTKRLLAEIARSNQKTLEQALDHLTRRSQAAGLCLQKAFQDFKLERAPQIPTREMSGQEKTESANAPLIRQCEATIDQLQNTIKQLRAANAEQAKQIARIQAQLESQNGLDSLAWPVLHRAVQSELRSIRRSFERALDRSERLHDEQQTQITRLKQQLERQRQASTDLAAKMSELHAALGTPSLPGASRRTRSAEQGVCEAILNRPKTQSGLGSHEPTPGSPQTGPDPARKPTPGFAEKGRQKCSEILLQSSFYVEQNSNSLFFSGTSQKSSTMTREGHGTLGPSHPQKRRQFPVHNFSFR